MTVYLNKKNPTSNGNNDERRKEVDIWENGNVWKSATIGMLEEQLKNGKRMAGLFSATLQLEIQELSVIICFSCAANNRETNYFSEIATSLLSKKRMGKEANSKTEKRSRSTRRKRRDQISTRKHFKHPPHHKKWFLNAKN